nr:hypothetical protein [Leptolyngbya sp. Prado105]
AMGARRQVENVSSGSSHRPWSDLRAVSSTHTIATTPVSSELLIEAASWHRNPQTGKVELVATQPLRSRQNATC